MLELYSKDPMGVEEKITAGAVRAGVIPQEFKAIDDFRYNVRKKFESLQKPVEKPWYTKLFGN